MMCVHMHVLISLFSDALLFNAGTTSVFRLVLQFKHILILKGWPTIPPHHDKHSPAVPHMPGLHLSDTFSHFLLRVNLSTQHFLLANRGGLLWLLQRASPEV